MKFELQIFAKFIQYGGDDVVDICSSRVQYLESTEIKSNK